MGFSRDGDYTAGDLDVLFQRGKTPGEIRLREMHERKRKLSEATIQKQVGQFAASIGLTLRPAKHGRHKKT